MRLRALLLVVLPFVIGACAPKSTPPAQTADTTASSAPSDTAAKVEVHALVDKLPAGVEGLELAAGGLRVQKGYKFVKDSDSTFVVARLSNGRNVALGGCGCKTEGSCDPVLTPDGIIVCQASGGCTDCGLALTAGGIRTQVYAFARSH